MNEELLYHIWKYQLFDHDKLRIGAERLQVLHPGQRNNDSGPDFFNARIRIGTTTWAGNVEIHVNSSDWHRHQHHLDKAFDNVVLHVVYNHDYLGDTGVGKIPALELKRRISPHLLKRYDYLRSNEDFIPCENMIGQVNEFTLTHWAGRMAMERVEEKAGYILSVLRQNRYDWSETFYQQLARNFGFNVNAFAFEQLARSLSLRVLGKHKNNLFQLEALLYGQAGLLKPEYQDEYPQKLRKEYQFLKQKYGLQPLPGQMWKMMRMRPANFPTIRIAQFAQVVSQSTHLFTKILEVKEPKEVMQHFKVAASEYWDTHYSFGNPSARKTKKKTGDTAVKTIIINTIAPFLFAHGNAKKSLEHRERALSLLEHMKPEGNRILRKFEELGVPNGTASDSQALLHLKKEYCDKVRCLQCAIGNKLLHLSINEATG
ncbi:MAG: DUF2851 family protein [Bacteroidia bacterium]